MILLLATALVPQLVPQLGNRERSIFVADCPSSDDLRHIGGLQKGGSGSSVIEIMRHAGDAANDDLRWSGV